MGIKKIGIPQTLLYQYYISFWKPFFEELGFEVVITPSTTKNILDKGVRKMAPEMCVPMKICSGHVVELTESNVDFIYIPRFVSINENNDFFCPKFMALPDMLKSIIPNLKTKILTNDILSVSDDITDYKHYIELTKDLQVTKQDICTAAKKARNFWIEYRNLCKTKKYNSKQANDKVLYGKDIKSTSKKPLKIGVVGYVYDVYDEFISMNVLERLEELGADTQTFETLTDKEIEKELKRFSKRLFWTFSNKTIASAYHFFEDDTIDGVIHITAFGCGPDAFIGKYLELDSEKYEKPFMTLRVDEHTGENHLQTRIEAFVDMLIKLKESEIA